MALPRLHLSLESDASLLADFYCGQAEMDEFIHTRLNAFLTAYNCRFYVVRDERETIVAMLVLSSGQLFLDEDCKDDLRLKFPDIEVNERLKPYWEAGVFPSIEIDYLAVQQEYRGRHIGSTLMQFIESFKSDVYYNNPLFLSVDAYVTSNYTAVPFYNKCRFFASELKNPFSDTLRMYRTIVYL